MWLDKPEQWEALAKVLRERGEFGYDTETFGQPDKTSPQHRARIHCWSVGVLTETRSPRGYRRAIGRVLPRAALEAPAIRAVLEDPGITKWGHNSPHDHHSTINEGLQIKGLKDSLQWARVAVPGMKDYGLKEMERWALGYGPRPAFHDMMAYVDMVVTARRKKERGCICGKTPCHAKGTSDWLDNDGVWRQHDRVEWKRFIPESKAVRKRLEVPQFVPGAALPPLHWLPPERPKKGQRIVPPSWWKGQPLDRLKEWWDYSALDAIRGIELVDWLRGLRPKALVYPWTPSKQFRLA